MGRAGVSRRFGLRAPFVLPALEILLALSAGFIIAEAPAFTADPAAQLAETGFFLFLVLFCSSAVVRLDRGQLRLTMIATQAAAMVLPPGAAGLVGLLNGLSLFRIEPKGRRYVGIGAATFWTACPATLRLVVGTGSPVKTALGYLVVAVAMPVMNWAITLVQMSLITGEPPRSIAKAAFTRTFVAAFVYFSLAAILIANLVDGSPRGYLLATIVVVLAVTLTENISERRSRIALEAQVADNQRYIGYSRALDGLVHSLRHQLAITKMYLEGVLEVKMATSLRDQAASAKASTDASLDMLERLSASASPRVDLAPVPIDLGEIAAASTGFVRRMAGAQHTRIETSSPERSLEVTGDPVLLRDVVTGLLINSLQAVEQGGWVRVKLGSRRGGWACLSVSDSGPGISEAEREHLFEPHYTTKANGTGLGLFTAYGVVREHRGQLLYEGAPGKGAVFSLLIPLAESAEKSVEPVAEARDGLNPAMIADRLSR